MATSKATKASALTDVHSLQTKRIAASDKTKKLVTPTKGTSTSLDRRMTVEKEIVDELLLVCGVIGTTTNGGNELVPVTDCLNWLQDLQRALRRDDDLFRPISLLLGKWKVVEQKLLPLVMTCRYDTPVVLTVVKILVILTKPLADNTKRAGKMIIDTSSKTDPTVIQQQIKLRENALEQAQLLMDYKRIVAHHGSHHSKESGSGLLSVFVSLLAEPLSRSGAARTETDHLTIELVLHLFRNLLSIDQILNTSSDISRQNSQLHQELIALFEKELVLEIFLVIGSDMESRENAQYNLLMMELLHHLLRTQDPSAVARSSADSLLSSSKSSAQLSLKLKQEQKERLGLAGGRHGHFGGTWMAKHRNGRSNFVGTGQSRKPIQLSTATRRKNRKAEPFIGSGKTLLSHSCKVHTSGPAFNRANSSLHNFCLRFMKDCYGPVMKSLKNEFRRDSVRLEEGDKVVFFRIVWFFCLWWRVSQQSKGLGHLIFTMDVFTFNLVLTSTDTFFQQKKHSRLAQTVALYSEMMHLLYDMQISKDKTDNVMARGLLDRLFYGSDPLDRLPRLLSRWSPGISTREYVCDLVELCHVSLKILDADERDCRSGDSGKEATNDKVGKMRATASQFDIKSYVCRKIASNQILSMYVHLLAQYKVNAATVNHRILSMFLLLGRTEVVSAEIQEGGIAINPLGGRRVTLEPMLFNIHLIMVADKVLNDTSIANDDNFKSLKLFCSSLLYKFRSSALENPMLFIDCLFRHVAPHRFCELMTNQYVNAELKLIAERQLLMEEHRQYEEEDKGEVRASTSAIDQDEDEELEFLEDDMIDATVVSTVTAHLTPVVTGDGFHHGNSLSLGAEALSPNQLGESPGRGASMVHLSEEITLKRRHPGGAHGHFSSSSAKRGKTKEDTYDGCRKGMG